MLTTLPLLVHGAALGALDANRSRALDECSQPFQACLESKCCHGEPAFGCHKRVAKAFAQCRRIAEGGCKSDQTWQCPKTWEDCTTPNYGNCWDSMCCMDPGMACLRSGDLHFAQCRPLGDCHAEGSKWKCPGDWTKPEVVAANAADKECTQPFQPCTTTHCCVGKAWRCIEKKNKYFAQCIRPDSCKKDDTHACNDVEGKPVEEPPENNAGGKGGGKGGGAGGGAPQHGAQHHPAQAVAHHPPRAAAHHATPAPAAGSGGDGSGGGGIVMLVVLFLVAVGAGVGGVFVYLKFAGPKAPTEAPMPDDPSGAPTRTAKGGKKKQGILDDDDGDVELEDGKKKKKKKKPKGEDGERLTQDVDNFD